MAHLSPGLRGSRPDERASRPGIAFVLQSRSDPERKEGMCGLSRTVGIEALTSGPLSRVRLGRGLFSVPNQATSASDSMCNCSKTVGVFLLHCSNSADLLPRLRHFVKRLWQWPVKSSFSVFMLDLRSYLFETYLASRLYAEAQNCATLAAKLGGAAAA